MLPNGGNRPPLSMQDINGSSGFSGRGNNLNAYRGTLFYRPDNSTGYFSSGTINISDFYSTQGTSPVVPGSATYTAGSTVRLPALFNTLTVTCYGGGGGGGGGSWLAGTTIYSGGNGGAGGSTSFGAGQSYAVSAAGGGGGGGASASYKSYLYGYLVADVSGNGSAGSNGSGADAASPAGGGGGNGAADSNSHTSVTSPNSYTDYYAANGGAGGSGGKNSILVFNIAAQGYAYVSQFYNADIPAVFGSKGSGGSGGGGYAGLRGADAVSGGKIILSWT